MWWATLQKTIYDFYFGNQWKMQNSSIADQKNIKQHITYANIYWFSLWDNQLNPYCKSAKPLFTEFAYPPRIIPCQKVADLCTRSLFVKSILSGNVIQVLHSGITMSLYLFIYLNVQTSNFQLKKMNLHLCLIIVH